jgi:hypothetical protein
MTCCSEIAKKQLGRSEMQAVYETLPDKGFPAAPQAAVEHSGYHLIFYFFMRTNQELISSR